MQPTEPTVPTSAVSARHRAAVDAYLTMVREASEDFAEAFRAQTEILRRAADRVGKETPVEPPRVPAPRTSRRGPADPFNPRPV